VTAGRNGRLGRWLVAWMCGVWLTAPALAAPADDLKKAVTLYNAGSYEQAQELLLKIDRDALTPEQKKQRDELVEAARTAINQADKARQDLEDADRAYAAGDRLKAERAYRAVLGNAYASDAQKKRAREGLGLLSRQRELAQQVASRPAVATRPAAAAERARAREERNRILAGDLVRAGDTALQRGQFDLATRHFQEALKLVPNHPAALRGLDLVRRQRGAEGKGDLLAEAVQRRRSRWVRTETLLAEDEKTIRRLIDRHEFAKAREKLQVASRLLEAGRHDAEPPERYDFLKRQLESLGRFIDAQEKAYSQARAIEERRIALQREQQRADAVRREKDERIARLMEEAMQLQKEKNYAEAADALREIIAIDPTYEYARFVLRMMEDSELIQRQKENRKTFEDRFQEGVLGAELARTPATVGFEDRFVAYPDAKEWQVIANRDPFGAKLTGESEAEREIIDRLQKILPEVRFDETDVLESVIAFLREEANVPIDVNWRALATAQIDLRPWGRSTSRTSRLKRSSSSWWTTSARRTSRSVTTLSAVWCAFPPWRS